MASRCIKRTRSACFTICTDRYVFRPPAPITYDAAKQFISEAFQCHSDLLNIETPRLPVEFSSSRTYVERYHEPKRKAYKCVTQEAPHLDNEAALKMAVKAVNDSKGPNGLITSLLVHGALPRLGPPNDVPTPSTFQEQLYLRMIHKRSQNTSRNDKFKDLGLWEGPYALLGLVMETRSVLFPTGPTPFRSTVVQRYITSRTLQNQSSPSPHQKIPLIENGKVTSLHLNHSYRNVLPPRTMKSTEIFDVMNAPIIPHSEKEYLIGTLSTKGYEWLNGENPF